MIRILLKKQLTEILYSTIRGKKKASVTSKLGVVLLTLFIVTALGGLFFILSWAIRGLISAGLGWLYYTLAGLVALVMGVVGSVFTTYSALYQAKDNDLLLSLPIPVRCILIARVMGVYLTGLLYSALVFVPAIIVYCITVPFDLWALVCALLMLPLISVFSLTLACALGWLVAKISSRLKHKSFVTVIVSLAFMGAYFYFYSNLNTLLTDLLANGALLGAKIQGSAYPLYLFGRIGTGDGLSLLLFGAVILALFALTAWLLSRSFLKLATTKAGSPKAIYRSQTAKLRSPAAALLYREFSHYLSSPIYILNASLGTVFSVIFVVFLLIKQDLLRQMYLFFLGDQAVLGGLVVALLVGFLSATNTLTAPSVSLEGKTIWLAQSLPVTPWQVLQAKLRLHILLTLPPVLLCAVLVCLILKLSAALCVLVLVLPTLIVLLLASLGLALNLRFPNLNWSSEAVPVKQGASVGLAMFGGWSYIGLLVGGCFLFDGLLPPTVYAVICCVLTAGIAVGLLCWLRHGGCRKFANLSS